MKNQTFTPSQVFEILGIMPPFSLEDLKKAYRARARQEHPDVSKFLNAKERFQNVQAVYEFALTNSSWFSAGFVDLTNAVCVDGKTKVIDLGKGVGPNKNGKPCNMCNGQGYSAYSNEFEKCPDCKPVYNIGLIFYPDTWEYRCNRCAGDGKFKRSGRVVGDCFACKGKGWFRPKSGYVNRCRTCNGSNRVMSKNKHLFMKCERCNGCGEIELFNPALAKGLLRGAQ